MSIVLPEIVLEGVLRESFKELRDDLSKLDDWFATYTDFYLEDQYGQKSIDQIKTFVKDNALPIMMSYEDLAEKIPCITLSILNFDEIQEEAFLGDYGFTVDANSTPTTIISGITFDSYDVVSGWFTLPNTTNISMLTTGNLLTGADGTTFPIVSIIDESGRKMLNLGAGSLIPAQPCAVVANLNFDRSRYLTVPVTHRILLSVHTKDAWMTKNLHYILVFFLLSAKQKLTNRNLLLTSWTASDFSSDLIKLPELVYSRTIDVYTRTYFTWLDAKDTLSSDLGDKIYVPKDIYPRPDGNEFTVDTDPPNDDD